MTELIEKIEKIRKEGYARPLWSHEVDFLCDAALRGSREGVIEECWKVFERAIVIPPLASHDYRQGWFDAKEAYAREMLALSGQDGRGGDCPSCKGSGTVKGMTQHLGPDDYEFDTDCPKCKGTGTAPSPDRVSVPRELIADLVNALCERTSETDPYRRIAEQGRSVLGD